jgi:hypothetical protein
MKRINFFAIVIVSVLVTISIQAQSWRTVSGNHNVVKKERDAGNFTGIVVSSGIDVVLSQGDNQYLAIEADENLHEHIITEVKNGVLHIYSDASIRNAEMEKAYVTMKDINSVSTTSAGDIIGNTAIKAGKLELSSTSAGSIKLELDVNDLSVDLSSSGDMVLSGNADILDADLSSAGDLNALDLLVREADISASSAGDASINVSERLTARASSAGDISYKGNPKYIDAHSSSGGDIRKR